jgi:hypothetical protein
MKKIKVQNYTAFSPIENGEKKYKIITNQDGQEIGIEVRGTVTSFLDENFNEMKFDKKAYDKCISEYFEKNDLNIPIDLMHVRDAFHLLGVCTKFKKTSSGVEIVAFIPKGVYFYGLVKTLIDNGILQGFSNMGFITNYSFEQDVLIVEEFQLISISLVDVPADVSGKFATQNTIFEGFESPESKTETKTETKNNLSIFGI